MFASVLMVSMSIGFAEKEIDKLQGTWQVQKLVSKGKEVDAEKAKNLTFVIEGTKINRFVNGVDSKDPANLLVVQPKKGPAIFSLSTGKKDDPPMLGIWELDGDNLKWCFSPKRRPTSFESPEGSDITFMILKRIKK